MSQLIDDAVADGRHVYRRGQKRSKDEDKDEVEEGYDRDDQGTEDGEEEDVSSLVCC